MKTVEETTSSVGGFEERGRRRRGSACGGRSGPLLCVATPEPLDEGLVEAIAKVVGQGHGLGLAIDLDGLASRIDQEPAVLTIFKMPLDVRDRPGIEFAVEK
jgi:hypothetical protein